ncbi:MAG TPA: PIG-L family deacetylase [Terriglobales bacterium]|nr:PIG-L family deacetylase [Terriglobales bacterium]
MPGLLCVTAHPDDEAGAFGGALLRYSERGLPTHVLCLTAGTAATHRGDAKSNEELSEIRRREFAASCKLLGVTQGTVLDYPDSALDRLDFLTVVADLTRRLRELRPDVVITIGPEGAVTAHPDHSMVSIFTTMACHWAGRSNRFVDQINAGLPAYQTPKLYYGTALFTMPDRQPVSLGPATATLSLSPRELETKIAAFKCHTSQAPLFPFFERMMHKRGYLEVYHLAAASTPRRIEEETDLFAGIA